jgi:hypothetical protein
VNASLAASAVPTTQGDLLGQLRRGLELNQRKVSTIKIDCTFRWEKWDVASKSWQYAGDVALTAWYDGIPGGKARIDFNHATRPWQQGAGPFSWDVSDYAFDGKVDRWLQTEIGTPQQPTKIQPHGQMAARRGSFCNYDTLESGWEICIYGGVNGLIASQALTDPNVHYEAEMAKFAGRDCIKLTKTAPDAGSAFFDPARGYAFLGKEGYKAGQLIYRTTILKLSEPAPGIFYPSKALVEFNYPLVQGDPPGTRSRGTFQATSIVVNDTDFDSDIFSIPWPPGAAVYNRDTHQVIHTP